ncbi:MAG: hypothetical protein KDD62_13990, partial [Bdellovibrionales bacterium]|nr:hypothetical protein [Bdellovibrionales bacterium]
LSLDEAENVCGVLSQRRIHAQPFYFPKTKGVWQATAPDGVPYLMHATKELLQALGSKLRVDYQKPAGFKAILPYLTVDTFRNFSINQWDTKLSGVLNAYSSSPSAPVLELIERDRDFWRIKLIGIDGADFPHAPNYYFIDEHGNPTILARQKAFQLITKLARSTRLPGSNRHAQYRNPEHFQYILKKLTGPRVQKTPINFWGTRLSTVLKHYGGSVSKMCLDVIENHPELRRIHKVGVLPSDFPKAPNGTWKSRAGEPTQHARDCIMKYIGLMASKHGVTRPCTIAGFTQLYPFLCSNWKKEVISPWGTTIRPAVEEAYQNSISRALKDVVSSSPKFRNSRSKLIEYLWHDQ